MFKIYHNTRCSKSREACSILQDKGVEFETIEYLKTPPTQKEIKGLLKMLGMKAQDIIRKGEPLFKEKFADKKLSESEWIKALAENPILIERPIIVKGNKAIIGRPPEKVLELIK
ncbi:MAG: arsenate reductase (glutaredoxin) [Bacteroidia bacterium]|nr:arsenate reductase (glutaredoxin) [Bacteroidia bacterium]